jgi:hypothetical protein
VALWASRESVPMGRLQGVDPEVVDWRVSYAVSRWFSGPARWPAKRQQLVAGVSAREVIGPPIRPRQKSDRADCLHDRLSGPIY